MQSMTSTSLRLPHDVQLASMLLLGIIMLTCDSRSTSKDTEGRPLYRYNLRGWVAGFIGSECRMALFSYLQGWARGVVRTIRIELQIRPIEN